MFTRRNHPTAKCEKCAHWTEKTPRRRHSFFRGDKQTWFLQDGESEEKRERNNALCVQQQQQCMSTTRKNRSRRDVSGIRYSVRAVGDKCLLLLILFSHTFLAYSERVLYSFLFVLGAHKREALINFLLRLPVKNERGTFFPLARAPRVVSARVSETHSWSLEGWEAQA